jgi:hypothetical protein
MLNADRARFIDIDGIRITVRPCVVTVPYVERIHEDGTVNDTWVDRSGYEAEACGIRAHGLTPSEAASRVREQLA